MSEPEIKAHMAVMREAIIRALTGPPPTAEERVRARGRELIERARRDTERCGQCGCHPDEHGGDW